VLQFAKFSCLKEGSYTLSTRKARNFQHYQLPSDTFKSQRGFKLIKLKWRWRIPI